MFVEAAPEPTTAPVSLFLMVMSMKAGAAMGFAGGGGEIDIRPFAGSMFSPESDDAGKQRFRILRRCA